MCLPNYINLAARGSKSGLPGFTLQFVGQTSLASATPHSTLLINVLFNETAIEWNQDTRIISPLVCKYPAVIWGISFFRAIEGNLFIKPRSLEESDLG